VSGAPPGGGSARAAGGVCWGAAHSAAPAAKKSRVRGAPLDTALPAGRRPRCRSTCEVEGCSVRRGVSE
jgi:hypothetical protein